MFHSSLASAGLSAGWLWLGEEPARPWGRPTVNTFNKQAKVRKQ
jgi:hypothetical protein